MIKINYFVRLIDFQIILETCFFLLSQESTLFVPSHSTAEGILLKLNIAYSLYILFLSIVIIINPIEYVVTDNVIIIELTMQALV